MVKFEKEQELLFISSFVCVCVHEIKYDAIHSTCVLIAY